MRMHDYRDIAGGCVIDPECDPHYKGHHLEFMTKVYYGFVKCVDDVNYEFVIAFPYM